MKTPAATRTSSLLTGGCPQWLTGASAFGQWPLEAAVRLLSTGRRERLAVRTPPRILNCMDIVYELRSDTDTVRHMQSGMLSEEPIGLKNTHGLVGTDEWWEQIAVGTLPIHEEVGVISEFWPGQWGDGPAEFELCDTTSRKSRWLCGVEMRAARVAFRPGRPACVRYVIQELKTAFQGRAQSKVTVSISLG